MPTYKSAPIAEAIIQLQFEDGLSDRDVDRVAAKSESFYKVGQEMQDFNVQVNVAHGSPIPSLVGEKRWRKLATSDGADLLILHRHNFTVARLAPYRGWEELFGRFVRDYEVVHKIVGYRKVNRIGVRYINRIDIPIPDKSGADVSKYLNVYPFTPHIGPEQMRGMYTRFETHDDRAGTVVIVTVAAADPVLINHDSYLLDIDVVKTDNISANRKEIIDQVDSLRHTKNQMFEALVTDAAKTRFAK